jgi:hypothetical protein
MRSSFGCFDGLPGCRSVAMPNCSSHAFLDLADGEQNVKASRRFLRAWLSWSDARLRRASSELEKLGWLCRKSSMTPAGDRAATEWRLPRIVIQTSATVRVEGVSYTGHGVSRKDKADHISRTHKKGDRARAREHLSARSPSRVASHCPEPSAFRLRDAWARFRPSSLRLVGRTKRAGAQRSLPSNAATIPPWAGQRHGVRNGLMSQRKSFRRRIPNTRSPPRSERRFANK